MNIPPIRTKTPLSLFGDRGALRGTTLIFYSRPLSDDTKKAYPQSLTEDRGALRAVPPYIILEALFITGTCRLFLLGSEKVLASDICPPGPADLHLSSALCRGLSAYACLVHCICTIFYWSMPLFYRAVFFLSSGGSSPKNPDAPSGPAAAVLPFLPIFSGLRYNEN